MVVNKRLAKKLEQLPTEPGVYFHKDDHDQIIYIGKAANLRNRVRQYFQASRSTDTKTEALVSEIADIEWRTVDTELDALLLEAELIRRYLPTYNILLRDDKSNSYVRIDYNSPHPTVSFTRRPLDDKAEYFGPYLSAREIRRALAILRRVFPFSTHTTNVPKRACLQYHLGLCPGLEENKTPLNEYRANLRKLMRYLKGGRVPLIKQVEKEMKQAAASKDFEKAAMLRNQLRSLQTIGRQILFYDTESLDISKDRGLQGLCELLSLKSAPRRIEGYDISHMSGTDNVASMVVFKNGLPDKASYRKFKMRLAGNNDFGHINEAIRRRLSEKNVKSWGLPDLFLIDGGKGQLGAATEARDATEIKRPFIGLAKREEEIIIKLDDPYLKLNQEFARQQLALVKISGDFISVLLPKDSDIVKLLQRIRDESHRFAVSYHSVLKVKRQTASSLDNLPGIGPVSRRKLLRAFGSKQAITQASLDELTEVVGRARAELLKSNMVH